jgi:hypothetical protein
VSGTLISADITTLMGPSASLTNALCYLIDGASHPIWGGQIVPALGTTGSASQHITIGPMRAGFTNGLNFLVSTTTLAAGAGMAINIYYTTP